MTHTHPPTHTHTHTQRNAVVPDSGAEDVEAAVAAGVAAFPAWSATTRAHRSALLMRAASVLEARSEEFALAESRDQGKPLSLARSVDVPRAIYNLRYFATAILHETQRCAELDGVAFSYVQRMPVGVAGLIIPWNLPLYLLAWKVAPALAYGCTCVCKPSELTSVTAWMLCGVLVEAGFPAGVVNMVFGSGPRCGGPLVAHPDVPLISFTGGKGVCAWGMCGDVPHAPACISSTSPLMASPTCTNALTQRHPPPPLT